MCSASLFLVQLKRVSAEKTQRVRTDLRGQLIMKNQVINLQFNVRVRYFFPPQETVLS